jgi:hypothetical protein
MVPVQIAGIFNASGANYLSYYCHENQYHNSVDFFFVNILVIEYKYPRHQPNKTPAKQDTSQTTPAFQPYWPAKLCK